MIYLLMITLIFIWDSFIRTCTLTCCKTTRTSDIGKRRKDKSRTGNIKLEDETKNTIDKTNDECDERKNVRDLDQLKISNKRPWLDKQKEQLADRQEDKTGQKPIVGPKLFTIGMSNWQREAADNILDHCQVLKEESVVGERLEIATITDRRNVAWSVLEDEEAEQLSEENEERLQNETDSWSKREQNAWRSVGRQSLCCFGAGHRNGQR